MSADSDMVERAEQCVEPMLADLRDRRLLKWLFSEDADIAPNAIGYVDGPIDCETQREICRALALIAIRTSRDADNG
jgi:hypothetical protein